MVDRIRIAVCIDPRYQPARERAAGVADQARSCGWEVQLICREGADAIAPLQLWSGHGVVAYRADAALATSLRRRRIPLVDTHARRGAVAAVHVDEAHLARQAVGHLAAIGRRHLAFCGIGSNPVSDLRFAAFRRIAAAPVARFAVTDEEAQEDLRPLGRWLRSLPRPAALWTMSDIVGLHALTAALHQGLRIPEDLAILGTGDDILLTGMTTPQLSSVRVPARSIGRAAAELLGRLLAGEAPPAEPILLPSPGVSARASTGIIDGADAGMTAAMRFIAGHAGTPIGVASVARAVGISRRSLERRFVTGLGRGVGEHLHAVRMQLAHDLLADGARSIELVAGGCGYHSAAAFSRAFRQHFGHSPSAHRRLADR